MIPCIDCKKPLTLSKRRKTGRCKLCSARATAISPAKRKKASASMKARLACPVERVVHLKRAHDGLLKHLADPVNHAALVERGRMLGLTGSGKNEKWYAGRAAAGQKRSITAMAWCPLEYRETYRTLVYVKNINALTARAMVLEMIKRDTRRYHATGRLQQAART
jgi:hypothetical protein